MICISCGLENAYDARFCSACGASLDEHVGERETRKIVTVVFTDIAGSTALGERLDPESLRRIMWRYFDAMQATLERHGGTFEKFIGDAIVAVFGVPAVHEDDALRAVRAVFEMGSRLEPGDGRRGQCRGAARAGRRPRQRAGRRGHLRRCAGCGRGRASAAVRGKGEE
jgi:class 3 adenylate cyclase